MEEIEINEETEIKFEMEREKQAKLLERQKILNQKLMLAMGKQKSLTKKLYKYKQLLIKEGMSHLVESTKINKIQINEKGEIYNFDAKYERFNGDEPQYSDKFVKRTKHEEVLGGDDRELVERENKSITRRKKNSMKNIKNEKKNDDRGSYMNQYSSKRLIGDIGNQNKKIQKKKEIKI